MHVAKAISSIFYTTYTWGPSAVPTASVLRSTLPGTPFRGPYPLFNLAQDRAPSATPHLFPQPHCVGTAASHGDTPLFRPGDHAPSPVLSRHTPVGPPPVPPYPRYDPYVPPPETPSGHAFFHGESPRCCPTTYSSVLFRPRFPCQSDLSTPSRSTSWHPEWELSTT